MEAPLVDEKHQLELQVLLLSIPLIMKLQQGNATEEDLQKEARNDGLLRSAKAQGYVVEGCYLPGPRATGAGREGEIG